MTAHTRSETAVVRPFTGLRDADAALEPVRLALDDEEYEQGSIVVQADFLTKAKVGLRLPTSDDVRAGVEGTTVSVADCELVVLGTAHTNRASQVLFRVALDGDDWATPIPLKRKYADLVLNDRHGFGLTVAIVLMRDREPKPLHPHVAGTWLARRDFKVSPESEDTSFSPEPLNDDIRRLFELPPGVMRYVHVDDDTVLDTEELSDAVRVFADEDLLNMLFADPKEPSAEQMQTELALLATDTTAVAIARALADDGEVPGPEALEDHPAASRLYERLAKVTKLSVGDLLNLAIDNQPVLRAHLEAAFDLQSATLKALKEK